LLRAFRLDRGYPLSIDPPVKQPPDGRFVFDNQHLTRCTAPTAPRCTMRERLSEAVELRQHLLGARPMDEVPSKSLDQTGIDAVKFRKTRKCRTKVANTLIHVVCVSCCLFLTHE
jgi:hypothetical protein